MLERFSRAKRSGEDRVMTPWFRANHVHLFEPHAFDEKQEAKYQVTMLFDKEQVDIKELRALVKDLTIEKWGHKPDEFDSPIRDGDKKKVRVGSADLDPNYEGHWYVKATTKFPPGVVNAKNQGVMNNDDPEPKNRVYSGCYMRATVSGFAYEFGNKLGVSFNLHNVQKLADGEPLMRRIEASDEFEDVSDSVDVQSEKEDWEIEF
jgi:hypothetical protein